MTEDESRGDGSGCGSSSTVTVTTRPLLTPEPFLGKGSFSEWLQHFEGLAAINKWDDVVKLLWLRVRLIGAAQTAYGRLPNTARESYANLTMKEMYMAEFHSRKKAKIEEWAEFADNLKLLVEKAFLDLEDKARERMALTRFMEQLENPQVAFSVRQKQPSTLVEAISAIIEMESYLKPRPSNVGQVEPEQAHTSPVIAAQQKQDVMMSMLENMMARLEKLETRARERQPAAARNPEPRSRRPIVCRNCHQEGHYARGCASPPARTAKDQLKIPYLTSPC